MSPEHLSPEHLSREHLSSGRLASAWRGHRTPLAMWAACALTVNWVQQVTYGIHQGGWNGVRSLVPTSYLPHAGRIAWDSGIYLRLADHGYRLEEGLESSFPLYALVIRALRGVAGSYENAAVCASLASGLAATLLFWRWMDLKGLDEPQRRTALALFLLYPYAFMMYGVVYSDALLVALVLAVLVCAEQDRWIAAGLLGAAATATRPTGLLVVPVLCVMVLLRGGAVRMAPSTAPDGVTDAPGRWRSLRRLRDVRVEPRRLEWRHLGVVLSVGGIAAYMAFLQRHAGDPFYFWTVQVRDYNHGPVTEPATWLKARFLADPGAGIDHAGDVVNEVVSTALLLATFAAAPAASRRFGGGYGVLLVGMGLTVWSSNEWVAPGGRYLLPVVWVLAALVAPWLAGRPVLRATSLPVLAAGSLLLTVGFAGTFDIFW